MLLEHKIALITGAASGIGEATARLFVAEGARVVLADIDAEGLEVLTDELGDAASALAGDITSEAYVTQLLECVRARHGRLDCAVNNAGISSQPAAIEQIQLADWQRMLEVNLTSVFLCLKYEIPLMKAGGGGAIVNIASGAGLIAVPFMADYSAAKHGVLGLTKTAAAEVVKEGVRVNAILPGSVETPMLRASMDMGPEIEKMIRASVPCGRFGRPDEVAQNCAWLCSDRASYVSGESMVVDHGTLCR